MERYAVLGLVVALLVFFYFNSVRGKLPADKAHQLVQEGALLLDVRTPGEYGAGHIEGAVNIPLQELDNRKNELGDKSNTIVVYCRSGQRSGSATRALQASGFSEVHDLGAMSRW